MCRFFVCVCVCYVVCCSCWYISIVCSVGTSCAAPKPPGLHIGHEHTSSRRTKRRRRRRRRHCHRSRRRSTETIYRLRHGPEMNVFSGALCAAHRVYTPTVFGAYIYVYIITGVRASERASEKAAWHRANGQKVIYAMQGALGTARGCMLTRSPNGVHASIFGLVFPKRDRVHVPGGHLSCSLALDAKG